MHVWVVYWANCLNYDYIYDAEIPENSDYEEVAHGKTRCSSVVLTNFRHIEDHPMWEDKDLCIKAVSTYGRSLEYVKHPTHKMCKIAVRQQPQALKFVPPALQTDRLCLAVVAKYGYCLQVVARPTPEICERAVRQTPFALRWTPDAMQTEAMCANAVAREPSCFKYAKCQTNALCMLAMRLDPRHALLLIQEPTLAMYEMAIDADKDLQYQVPNKYLAHIRKRINANLYITPN